jgi:hypothetical protein
MDQLDVTVRADDLFVSSNTPPGRAEKRGAIAFALAVVVFADSTALAGALAGD